ncbi:hypothetical protein D3C71_1898310 [compost metagenome]
MSGQKAKRGSRKSSLMTFENPSFLLIHALFHVNFNNGDMPFARQIDKAAPALYKGTEDVDRIIQNNDAHIAGAEKHFFSDKIGHQMLDKGLYGFGVQLAEA